MKTYTDKLMAASIVLEHAANYVRSHYLGYPAEKILRQLSLLASDEHQAHTRKMSFVDWIYEEDSL